MGVVALPPSRVWGPGLTDLLLRSVLSARSIIRMLNGRHHLDEIRFRTQLSRKHLSLVLSAFEEDLVLFTHP